MEQDLERPPESIGAILDRIVQGGFRSSRQKWFASGKPLSKFHQEMMDAAAREKAEACPICKGRAWVVDPDKFGDLKPCPCGAVETRRRDFLAARANLPKGQPLTFDLFDLRPGTAEAVEAAKVFARGAGPHILTIVGEKGAGKSFLLEATARAILSLEPFQSVRFQNVPAMLYDMRRAIGDQSGPTEAETMCRIADVLLLDDLGADKPSEWVEEVLYLIINNCYMNDRRLMVTTNLSARKLANQVGSRVADRIWDHKTGHALPVVMDAASYRTGERWE